MRPFQGRSLFRPNVLEAFVPKKTNSINFEKTLAELEQLVAKMEKGDLSLEESLKYFERGILLTKACQQALSEAEQKVSILLNKDGKSELKPFDQNSNNE
jgi:exodeoxyribonuclease VII small subunit